MAQGYKLRLGDGTTFAVDEKGLHTWLEGRLMDESARIQPQGTTQWLTVRQLQAFERDAAEREAMSRRVAERQAEAARKAAEEQKVEEERKAADEAAARERLAEQERLAAEQQAEAARKAAEESRAAEEQAEAARRVATAEKKAAAENKAAADKKAADKKALAKKKTAAEKKAAAERQAAEERKAEEERKAAEARAEAERKAAAEKAAAERRAAAEKAAAEKAAAEKAAADRKAAAERQAAEEKAAREREAAEEQAAREREAAEREAEEERRAAEARAEVERKAAAEKKAAGERKAADERRAEEERRLAEARAARERETQEQERALERQAAGARAERERLATETDRSRSLAAFDDLEEPGGPEIPIAPGGPEIALGPVAMGMDDSSPLYEVDSQLKRIPMVPASEADRDGAGWSGPAAVSQFESVIAAIFDRISPFVLWCERWVVSRMRARRAAVGGTPWPAAVASASPAASGTAAKQWMTLPKAWAARAAAAVAPLMATARHSLSQLPRLKWPRAAASSGATPTANAAEPAAPAPRPEIIDIAEPPLAPAPEKAVEPIRPAEPLRVLAAAEPIRPAEIPRASSPSSRPPTPFNDLPVIKLAEINEPEPEEDEFDDGPMSRVSEGLATGWAWVKSLTVTAILLVVIVVLVQNYKTWFPRAMGATLRLFSGMDDLKAKYAPPEASREALEAATQQLPQLAPATIETIMTRTGSVALAPTEVFRRASEAAARGKAALAPTASGELDSHMTALLGELNESEAASLRRYMERVAAGEAMLPYEDNEAMWLTARGARRLPPERLARVQQLHAQAITLGLPSKPAPEEPSLPSLPPLPSLPAFEGPSR